jgi:cytoskeletal protein CcmA (bactofilin family)
LLAAGRVVEFSEAVPGDVLLAGGDVRFSGTVGGSYLGVGGLQEVEGWIEGSARMAGGTVRIGANVARNATLVGGTVEFLEDGLVERNAYFGGGRVVVSGTIRGDLLAAGAEVVIDGTVDGDAHIEADRLTLGPSAHIGGDLIYRVGSTPASIDGGSRVDGLLASLPPRERSGPAPVVTGIGRILAFLVTAGAFFALFPDTVAAALAVLRSRPAAALGAGFFVAIGLPVLVVFGVLTVVGLPLAAVLAGGYLVAIYLSPAVSALWLGDRLLPASDRPERIRHLQALGVGGAVLGAATLLPWIGFLVRMATGLLGLGAAALAIGSSRR